MGPDKKKVVEHFPISKFISGFRGIEIEKLWRDFFNLYQILRKPVLLDSEIDKFENDAKNWVRTFCRATEGIPNSITQKPGLYRKQDVTPYMHVFAQHIHQFMRQLNQKNLALRFFSTSSLEKKNHNHVSFYINNIFLFLLKKIINKFNFRLDYSLVALPWAGVLKKSLLCIILCLLKIDNYFI